jgi:hypothetical protein
MKCLIALALVALLNCGTLSAAEAKSNIRGIGSFPCAWWLHGSEPSQENAGIRMEQWIDGYWSGLNTARNAAKHADILEPMVIDAVRRACDADPSASIADAARRAYLFTLAEPLVKRSKR